MVRIKRYSFFEPHVCAIGPATPFMGTGACFIVYLPAAEITVSFPSMAEASAAREQLEQAVERHHAQPVAPPPQAPRAAPRQPRATRPSRAN